MDREEIDSLREYHVRRSAQERRNALAGNSDVVAERHFALHQLHELMFIDLCCFAGASVSPASLPLIAGPAEGSLNSIGRSLRSILPLCRDASDWSASIE